MNTLDWATTRQRITQQFDGQTPRPDDENTIIELWELAPAMVTRAADELAPAVKARTITWGWSALRARLERGNTPTRDATTDPTRERANATAAAERWIANAGLHIDRDTEILDELFASNGLLHRFAQITWHQANDNRQLTGEYAITGDQTLPTRMLTLWHQARPRGEAAEQASLEHQRRCLPHPPKPTPTATTTDDFPF